MGDSWPGSETRRERLSFSGGIAVTLVVLAAARVLAGEAEPAHPPFTLFPGPVQEDELLRFVIPGAVHRAPDRESEVLSPVPAGEEIRAVRLVEAGGIPWVEIRRGYVEAARVDRPPEPVEEDLPVGREGMAAGRILPRDYRPSDLAPVPDSLKAAGLAGRQMELRSGALEAFRRLLEAAARDGVRIGIVSAFRDAAYQGELYARAVDRDPTQSLSAAPGRSEHQLGTAADVAAGDGAVLTEAFGESAAGRWIARRAGEFGIVAPFSRERHTSRGVGYEPWHLRWVGSGVSDEGEW